MAGCNQARLAKSEGERLMAQASAGWLQTIGPHTTSPQKVEERMEIPSFQGNLGW